ncbi:unnamed protein product [Euphydryas editha]|uniref:Uncharacterized protein n=1 Tax=Euphydryas editha TaxID=104508 RepID=A0AAU9U3M3_EUPED|nr:unnamed protein product [Euphydryas editha]
MEKMVGTELVEKTREKFDLRKLRGGIKSGNQTGNLEGVPNLNPKETAFRFTIQFESPHDQASILARMISPKAFINENHKAGGEYPVRRIK